MQRATAKDLAKAGCGSALTIGLSQELFEYIARMQNDKRRYTSSHLTDRRVQHIKQDVLTVGALAYCWYLSSNYTYTAIRNVNRRWRS